ncbi:MAG: uncharacterized protein K0S45_1482 [Nitrospira sp.]|jgi:hypothetical protein|nr:uncharacterized protein [Nitrospira sp.]
MSSALAIAGVTAVLRDLLNDGLINHNVSGVLGSTVTVSALPPDRVAPVNGAENTQLNLFLHQVTPNLGWRNESLPSRDGSGRNRLSNPPLALDLHYLLSAYGAEDLHAEILLGYGMQLFHETPVLNRSAIATALNPSPLSGTTLPQALQALASCGLADQLEQIKVTPEYLNTEETSKLWTAVQAHYRPTAAYLVTVVLIESALPTRATLPVLSRGPVDPATKRDRGVVVHANLLPPFPTIQTVLPTDGQPAATVGATVELTGHHLDGANPVVIFTNARFDILQEVAASSGGTATTIQVVAPTLPVGFYQVAVRVVRPTESDPRTSNQLSLVLGPKITTALPVTIPRDGGGTATIALGCAPDVRSGQQVSLLLGSAEVSAEPWSSPANSFTFVVEQAPVGDHLARLRVDGIESPLIDRMAKPPVFFDHRITIS